MENSRTYNPDTSESPSHHDRRCVQCGQALSQIAVGALKGPKQAVPQKGPLSMSELTPEPPVVEIAEEVIERMRGQAKDVSSGEDDPELRRQVEEKAYKYLYNKVYRARHAAQIARVRRSKTSA